MADELKLTIGFTYKKNGRERIVVPSVTSHDIDNSAVVEVMQTITTSAGGTAVELGPVTEAGFCVFRNAGSFTLEIGFDDSGFVPVFELEPGDRVAGLQWAATAPYARAVGGSTILDAVIVEANIYGS